MSKDVVRGVVIRGVPVKNSDLMLTVYTHERGIMSIYARGAKKSDGKKNASATSDLAYSEFVITERQDKIWASEVNTIKYFECDMRNFEGFSLNFYIAELYEHIATAEADETLMRLMLNTLYASSSGRYNHYLLKAAFEIRLLSHIGFMPDLSGCAECGARGIDLYFDVATGRLKCSECLALEADEYGEEPHPTVIITEGARAALDYATSCPLERLFSFTLSGEDLVSFSRAAESYLIHQLDRDFVGLEYFRNVDKLNQPI